MRQNRFYLTGEINSPSFSLTSQDIIGQLKNVLRSKAGDVIYLFDGQGTEVKAEIKDFKKDVVELNIISQEEKEENNPQVSLYLAILKKENFELAVQKAVEAGVRKIIPIITERTIKLGLKTERLQLIIREATEQSGRNFLPELSETISFTEAIGQAGSSGALNIFCDLEENILSNQSEVDNLRVNLFVGPEGGWGINEREVAKLAGFTFYSLGPYVLRAETAATVATWLAINKRL